MGRLALPLLAIALSSGSAGYLAAQSVPSMNPARIVVDVRRFAFAPKEIRVKKGQPVTFALSADDFVHGFSIPNFNVRADVIPGKTIELTLVPDRVGKFTVLCDNFCGEDHDKMTGFLIVTDQ